MTSFWAIVNMFWLTLVGLGLVSGEVLRRRWRVYRRAVPYDVRADYRLQYDPTCGHCVDLQIVDDRVVCNGVDGPCDSAFLELEVAATVLGNVVDPYVELSLGGATQRHYFERGGQGKRFFDVTQFANACTLGAQLDIRLRGTYAIWRGSKARLHVLREAAPPDGPILVLAPHPDDAEIAAFGLFSQRLAWVVTITLGDGGPNPYAEFFAHDCDAYFEKARIRVWDSVTVPRTAGVPEARTANLGYFDGTLSEMFHAPSAPVKSIVTGESDISKLRVNPLNDSNSPRLATWQNLIVDLKEMLIEAKPVAIVLPHPILDPHPDHLFTTIACLEAMTQVSLGSGKLLFYANHLRGTEMYPFGASDGVVSPPPIHDEGEYCQSMLSLALSGVAQLRKQVAIETVHDLRPPSRKHRPSLMQTIHAALLSVYEYLVRADNDYVRRAARPNELFFVVDYSHVARLLSEWVSHSRRGGEQR
jgi:LmbE family N-acetylglucosaminyl deacetylase